ncbi:MAG: DUF262 domain-containing HNH endonuclease family protein [Candidatus Accumulibacter sp.]|jgi:hypothetical protein|nr:DUF262 domain-containing HNH endonuclease family protein [Accumulibacter sp.]
MGHNNLLKTSDLTFIDLVGNSKKYRVPAFQRDYSWEQEQWEDLWNDIEGLTASLDARHYMGAIVVEARSDRDFLIVDGQQRVATLSILALAVISVLQNLGDTEDERARNRDRATRLRERFIGEKDPASLLESSKLVLNANDDAFYQDYLVQLRPPNNPRGMPNSNRLLWECFCWFKERLTQKLPQGGEWFASLLSETVARQLLFILIAVEDELSAYVVFETLNARGLELSSTDLLKNYLFSRVSVPADLTALQRRWKTLVDIVRQERFPDFLRYHLLCESPQIRKQRLFKDVRDQVKTPAQVFALMDAIERRAELFAAINDAEHEYWQENPPAKPYVRELLLFRASQMTPLLFAAYEKLDPADFVRVLKLVSVISFRYTIVGGLNTNALEPVYHRAAKALLTDQISSPAEIFKYLRDIYVEDEKFRRDFEIKEIVTSGQSKRIAKYVLCKLETSATGVPRDYEADTATIEHILPENPSAAWIPYFTEERQKDFTYRLGNLSLLEPALNRQAGNGLLADKLPLYAQSAYEQTRSIAERGLQEWMPASLDERQRKMAQKACHVWRSDFV